MRNIGTIISLSAFILLTCCTTENEIKMDPSIILSNSQDPFVTKKLAESISILIVREKYPEDIFDIGEILCSDVGYAWKVSIKNKLFTGSGTAMTDHITIFLRKSNGEIVKFR